MSFWRKEDAASIRIVHPLTEHYAYHLGRRFDPGAQAEAFEQPFPKPINSLLGKGAVRSGGQYNLVAGQFNPLQHPQVMVRHVIPIAGIPTIAGQYFLQPLDVGTEEGT